MDAKAPSRTPTTFRGYRIDSSRRRGWNTGASCWYFITFCTRHRAPVLARVVNRRLVLLPAGRVAARCWMEIAERHPGVRIDRWVVMPDHVHGLIKPAPSHGYLGESGPGLVAPVRQWRPESVGVLINQYQRAVTVEARRRGKS